jgi:hypothetical protein
MVSTKYLLYKIRLSQRVIVHNMLTLIVYQGFDQYGSKVFREIFNQGF